MIFIAEDSSFIVSLLNTSDIFHDDAVKTLRVINKYNYSLVLPEIALSESMFVLMRSGFTSDNIRSAINRLTMLPRVIIHNTGTMTTLRYCSKYYDNLARNPEGREITKTHDYLIACSAVDYNGILLGADQQMLETVSQAGIISFNFQTIKDRRDLKEYLANSQVS